MVQTGRCVPESLNGAKPCEVSRDSFRRRRRQWVTVISLCEDILDIWRKTVLVEA